MPLRRPGSTSKVRKDKLCYDADYTRKLTKEQKQKVIYLHKHLDFSVAELSGLFKVASHKINWVLGKTVKKIYPKHKRRTTQPVFCPRDNARRLRKRLEKLKNMVSVDKAVPWVARSFDFTTKLTPRRYNLIVRAVRRGNFITTAATAAGVNRATVSEWLRLGNDVLDRITKGDKITNEIDLWYAQFALDVDEAQAHAEMYCVNLIMRAGKKDWRAADRYLSKRHRDNWGDNQIIQHEGGGKPIQVETSGPITIEQQRTQMLAVLAVLRRAKEAVQDSAAVNEDVKLLSPPEEFNGKGS